MILRSSKKYLLLLLVSVSPLILTAQQIYKGEYSFNGIKGEGVIEFVEGEEKSMIKQGEFRFLRKEKDREDKTRFLNTEVKGIYEQDKKSGLWEYIDERHFVLLNDVEDFRLLYDINSQQIKLKANYKEGLPDGIWTFEENEYKGGKLSRKSQAEDFRFRNGDIQGRFQYKSFVGDKTHFIRGELTRNGDMNGEWTFVYEENGSLISEVRNYENGFLLGIVKRDLESDKVLEEVVFYQTIKKLNQVNAQENKGFRISEENFGILFNDGFLSGSEQFKIQEAGNQFITEFLTNVLRYDEQFVNEKGELIDYPIHTKKFVFELSRAEQRIVEELPVRFDRIRATVKDYAERNSLRLNRQKSDSLSFAYAYFQYQVGKLDQFSEIMDLFRSKDIQFYDLENLVEEGLPFLTEIDKVEYSFEDSVRIRELEYRIGDLSGGFYGVFESYINQIQSKTNEIKLFVDKSLTSIERDDDLRSLQNQIQERKDDLDEMFSNTGELDNKTIELLHAVQKNILGNNFNQINERYARETEFAGKKEVADIMIDLLDEMENQFELLVGVYPKFQQMDELYMEEVFNPFTYTRYEQRAKNRLYESAEKLLEYYLEQLAIEQNYTEIKIWLNKADILFERMGELREADTRRIERRINRRQSVSKIESLLEL